MHEDKILTKICLTKIQKWIGNKEENIIVGQENTCILTDDTFINGINELQIA